jgi:hypothetical protein
MTGAIVIADKIALTLFERYGGRALVHVTEQIELLRKKGDLEGVKTWRHVGAELEKLARVPAKT